MAKAKRPAAKKPANSAAKKPAAKSAAAKSSASAAASKASAAVADASADVAKTSTAVSPSEMKKQLEASDKPVPQVAKEPPASEAAKEVPKPEGKEPVAVQKAKSPVEKAPVVTPPAAEPAAQRSAFLPLVLGGVVAAGLGYFASELDLFGTRGGGDDILRASVESQDTRLSALEAAEVDLSAVDTLAEQVAGSNSRLEDLSTQISGAIERLDTLQTESTAVAERLEAIDTRLSDVEKRPITENANSEAAVAAYERELAALTASVEEQRAALQESVDAQRAEVEALLDNAITVEEAAAEAAKVANIQKALTGLTSALGSGAPFDAPLAALAEQGVTDLPAALSDVAADGVQTLSALQGDFPDKARAALGAARASGEPDEEEAGFGGFLRRQLGARSLTPKEGNGPDAVLSRAEAAVREGRLNDALGELEALPAPAQDAIQDWLDAARARADAQAAIEELSQSLTAN